MFISITCNAVSIVVAKSLGKICKAKTENLTREYAQKISEILIKYSWPASTNANLPIEEQKQLFAANNTGIEEKLIEKELDATVDKAIETSVFFIPNTIYELIALHLIKDKIIDESNYNFFKPIHSYDLESIFSKSNVDEQSFQIYRIRKQIQQYYHDKNQRVCNQQYNLVMQTNQNCLNFLIHLLPELKNCQNGIETTTIIKNNIEILINNLTSTEFSIHNKLDQHKDLILEVCKDECATHEKNQALLLRSTPLYELPTESQPIHLCASPEIFELYSASYGGSLFAGFPYDETACMYKYATKKCKRINYILSIDKKDYHTDRLNQSLNIPPLHPLTSLFSRGEYWHPRSIAATQNNNKPIQVQGIISSGGLNDPSNYLIINRDPAEQREILFNLIAENGKILQYKALPHLDHDPNIIKNHKLVLERLGKKIDNV